MAESPEPSGPEYRSIKIENSSEYEYTIDIFVKNSSEEKINSLRKVLEEYK